LHSMTRIFHHRFTLGARCGVLLLALLSIYFVWIKSILIGIVLVLLDVLIIERVLHSEYIIDDRYLVIYRGRFARKVKIDLRTVRSCQPLRAVMGCVHYLLLEYGDGRQQSLQPEDEASFIHCLMQHVASAQASASAESLKEAQETGHDEPGRLHEIGDEDDKKQKC
jgi:hypothetical protein